MTHSHQWTPLETTMRRRRIWQRVGYGAILVAFCIWGISILLGTGRRPGYGSTAIDECRRSYAHARTAADSAMVDLQHPSTGYQKGAASVSCLTLQRAPTHP